MQIFEKNNLKYYCFESFSSLNIPHGFFSRIGGCSPVPWNTLNMATSVGDSQSNVINNRNKILTTLNRSENSIFDSWQVHGNAVLISNEPRKIHETHKRGDGIVTDNSSVTLMMLFADCVPIFLFDPRHHVVAIAHAGWQGTVNRISESVVKTLVTHFETRPCELVIGIGPSIGVDHYEIGLDVKSEVESKLGIIARKSLRLVNKRTYFDLWYANQAILQELGILRIEVANICTACDTTTWFSHRGENGKTGRFAGVLGLPE